MLKSIRDMRHSPNVPEFFIPKGPYKSMAKGPEQLKMRSKLIKRITLGLEWAYYVAVIALCTSCIMYLSGLWSQIFYY